MNRLIADIPRKRRFRVGMIGGGKGAFFGSIHRAAMRLSDQFEIVSGAFSSDAENNRQSAIALGVSPDRAYTHFAEMAQAEAARPDRLDAVIVVTPNHLHFQPCKLFLEAGIPVICDKPLVHTSEEARELQRIAAAHDTFFAVTYTYTGYPMVRDARARIRDGEIGDVRFLYAEYLLEWLADDPAKLGKGGAWRGDPAVAGPTGALGDVGTHAFQMLEFVSGLRCTSLNARLLKTVPGFGLEDTNTLQLEFGDGSSGLLWSSLASPGHRNGLRIKIVGTKGNLSWQQEAPETLHLSRLGASDSIYRRGQRDNTPDAMTAASLPAGNPEAYIEALANLYCDYATALEAGPNWRQALKVPVADLVEGLRGVMLSELAVASSTSRTWVDFPST